MPVVVGLLGLEWNFLWQLLDLLYFSLIHNILYAFDVYAYLTQAFNEIIGCRRWRAFKKLDSHVLFTSRLSSCWDRLQMEERRWKGDLPIHRRSTNWMVVWGSLKPHSKEIFVSVSAASSVSYRPSLILLSSTLIYLLLTSNHSKFGM